MKWITREKVKVDRVACPWLVARFIHREPEFLFVLPAEVMPRGSSFCITGAEARPKIWLTQSKAPAAVF
jgi:hypothetical protein